MKRALISIFITLVVVQPAHALEAYRIDIDQSRIEGSIHYAVVGKYRALFEDYGGKIYLDPESEEIKGVELYIKTASITSKAPNLDKIVKSPQLLDAPRYPEVIYESYELQPGKDGSYQASGHLNLHGVIQRLDLPFTYEGPMVDDQGRSYVRVKGKWVFNRKKHNIIWNRLLDKGGIFVGNHITVDWEIVALKK